jgi:glutaredoxin 3
MTASVLIYCTGVCPYSTMAEELLKSKGATKIEKAYIDRDPRMRDEMRQRTGKRTVPQIFIGETYVGGLDDLSALDDAGELERLIKAA